MHQRAQQALALPKAEQQEFYYCGGRNKTEFTAAVASGEPDALALALNVVAGELWLCPRDGARYARSIRAALRVACEAGLLDDAQKRVMYAVEMRNLERLVLRGRHSVPGMLQQRAERRIPGQLQIMLRCFGEVPKLRLKTDDFPDVKAPRELLQQAVQYGWFSADSARRMADSEASMLSELIHGADDVFFGMQWYETMPNHARIHFAISSAGRDSEMFAG